MVGLVVATHGRLAEELLRTAEGIVGPLEQCDAVSVGAGASMEDARARLAEAKGRVEGLLRWAGPPPDPRAAAAALRTPEHLSLAARIPALATGRDPTAA